MSTRLEYIGAKNNSTIDDIIQPIVNYSIIFETRFIVSGTVGRCKDFATEQSSKGGRIAAGLRRSPAPTRE
jgi:hypothetical protein